MFFWGVGGSASTDCSPLFTVALCAVNLEICVVRVWLQIQAQPRSDPFTPSNSDVSSFLPFLHSFFSSPLIVPPLFCHVLTISPLSLHLLLAPLAFSVADALDSVVVSALRHNLRLLGGAGLPVALRRRHSVCAHYRHNLLLSPVSKPREWPLHKDDITVRGSREEGWRGKEGQCLLCLQRCAP